jgi:hypothetical protein
MEKKTFSSEVNGRVERIGMVDLSSGFGGRRVDEFLLLRR